LVSCACWLARIAWLTADTLRARILPPGSRWRAGECSRAETSSLALPLKLAAAGSKPGRCHETPLRRLANFEVDSAHGPNTRLVLASLLRHLLLLLLLRRHGLLPFHLDPTAGLSSSFAGVVSDTLGLRPPYHRKRCHRTSKTAMEKMQIIVIFP
jgi:hypothetical protein